MKQWPSEKRQPLAIIRGNYHFGCGADIIPENVTISQYYDLTSLKRSAVRMTDQLVPRPTAINLRVKEIAVPTAREHPYQSHVSRFALFPTFLSPDDPDSGVRTAERHPLNPLIPASIPDVTVRSKISGAAYRHEVLKVPRENNRRALSWPGQQGFYHYPKSMAGASEVFYPTPPKTICPNPSLRPSETTLSERTARILRNIERSHWLTSYQLDFTGSGPMNPVKLDDFEKTMSLTDEETPNRGQLRERSHPLFIPSRPLNGRKARLLQGRQLLDRHCPTSPCPDYCGVQASTASSLAALSPKGWRDRMDGNRSVLFMAPGPVFPSTKGQPCEACGCKKCECQKSMFQQSLEAERESIQEPAWNRPSSEGQKTMFQQSLGAERESIQEPARNRPSPEGQKTMFQQSLGAERESIQEPVWSLEAKQKSIQDPEWNHPASEGQSPHPNKMKDIEVPYHSTASPRWPTFESTSGVAQSCLPSCQSALLELQNSFSKTEAHNRFLQDFQGGTVDLRENVDTGKRHRFFGANSYYFH